MSESLPKIDLKKPFVDQLHPLPRTELMDMSERCADCGGFDLEWMYRCEKHGAEYCRGCECPACFDDEDEDYCYSPDDEDKLT